MKAPPAARPIRTSAEVAGTAPKQTGEVFLRDFNGDGARRISRDLADKLVAENVAVRVSAAGHLRLKPGTRSISELALIHGIPAVEESRMKRGDIPTAKDLSRLDRRGCADLPLSKTGRVR
jgi:hypothetical protein